MSDDKTDNQKIWDKLNERYGISASAEAFFADRERVAEQAARIAALEAALEKIANAPAWGAPDRWETTPSELREFARAALAPAPAPEGE